MFARVSAMGSHLMVLHGHLFITCMTVYALGVGVHHMNQVDKVLRRFHEWETHVEINHRIRLTVHLMG